MLNWQAEFRLFSFEAGFCLLQLMSVWLQSMVVVLHVCVRGGYRKITAKYHGFCR